MGIVVTRLSALRKERHGCLESSASDVAQMWSVIDNLPPVERLSDPCFQTNSSEWVTIRVFVSSTFDDFHSEREILVKEVFPELREWCEARRMCLVECDLRWGIPADTSSGKIFATCLGELDQCHQDTLGMPFMVVLLGERAGWVPDIAEVPQEIVETYNWINGMSVTGTEILHGAYRNANPNAAFCLRESSFLTQLPLQYRQRYHDNGYKALLMQSLKEKVCRRFPKEQLLHYECQVLVTENATGIEKVKLEFAKEFSSWIVQFLKTRILKTFPGHSEVVTESDQVSCLTQELKPISELMVSVFLCREQTELTQHQLFLQQKKQLFLGRDLEIQRILEFLLLDSEDQSAATTVLENKESADWRNPLFQVISEPGMGKSSLLTACINRALQLPNSKVFYHFVGCCPSSVQLSNIVMRLCYQFMPAGSDREVVLLKLRNCWKNEEMKDILQQILQETVNMAAFIFIDAVNQLSLHSDVSDLLSWLNTQGYLPLSCKCVISCTPTSALQKEPAPHCLYLDHLSLETAQSLAVLYLSRYSKTLSSEQLEILLQNPCSSNPLWLSLACEELRVFGVFEMLTKKILTLPDTLQGLLGNIIQRLVEEDQSCRVRKLLCLVKCCQEGVAERDLQGAMSILEGGMEIPTMYWASLRRTLKCLLRTSRDYRGRDSLGFFHSSVSKAVDECLLSPDNSQHLYLVSLADYYEYNCTDDATVVYQLPRLLQQASLNGRLVNFLRKDSRARAIQAHTRAQYLKALRCSHVCRDGFLRSPAMMCGMCSLKIGAFGQMFLNRQSCILCGGHVAFMGREAFLCPRHFRIGRTECVICGQPILGVPPPSPGLLCHMCGYIETCIAMNI